MKVVSSPTANNAKRLKSLSSVMSDAPPSLVNSEVKWKFLSGPPSVEIVQVAFSGGQPKGGVELGPQALIENGIAGQLEDLGWKGK